MNPLQEKIDRLQASLLKAERKADLLHHELQECRKRSEARRKTISNQKRRIETLQGHLDRKNGMVTRMGALLRGEG